MSDTIYIQDNGKKRKATAEEIAQIEKDRLEFAEQARLFEAEQTAKAEAKASAMAKLAALGLSDEEVQAIIGA
jgi:hypothetical protein